MNNMQQKIEWQAPDWFRVFCLALLVFATGVRVNAQCTNIFAFGTITANIVIHVAQTISTCSYQEEYSTVNGLLAGSLYQTAITSGGYITIHQGSPSGPVIAHGASPLTWASTVAGTYYPHWNVNAACVTAAGCVVTTITYLGASSACSGTPNPGNTLANGVSTLYNACVGSTVSLTLQNNVGSGATYQWRNLGGNIAGATNASYSYVYAGYEEFDCEVTCAGNTTISNLVIVDQNSYLNCYCQPTMFASNPCSWIDALTTTGANVDITTAECRV